MLRQNDLTPKSVCDVGCGAGKVLSQLQKGPDRDCYFRGYDITPASGRDAGQAIPGRQRV